MTTGWWAERVGMPGETVRTGGAFPYVFPFQLGRGIRPQVEFTARTRSTATIEAAITLDASFLLNPMIRTLISPTITATGGLRTQFPYKLPFLATPNHTVTASALNTQAGSINAIGDGTAPVPQCVTVTSTTPLELTTAFNTYVYTGSTAAAWTMPAVTGNTGVVLMIVNRGTNTLTLQRQLYQLYYSGAAVTSVQIPSGVAVQCLNDGTYWLTG